MKSYSLKELNQHCLELQEMIGAQLQEIETHPKGLALSLYRKGQIWWILDLSQQCPMSLVFYEHSPWGKKQSPKPLALFLNSHAKNLFLSKVSLKKDAGRVLEVDFMNSQKLCQLEIHLIPKACNVIARTEEKSISWERPKDLGAPPQIENELNRDLADIKTQWLEESQGQRPTQVDPGKVFLPEDWEKQRQKKLTKKKKALDELRQQLEADLAQKWQTLGELLKSFEIAELGNEWKEFLTKGIGRYEQMELAFSKAKQLEAKKQGTRERISILESEIETLQAATTAPPPAPQNKSSQMMKQAGAEGRIRKFGDYTASRGKSAADNMALLRKARAWDIWVHLRDYPSTHAIVSLEKNQKLPESIIRQVALWVAAETRIAQKLPSGSKLDTVVAECRFVRPIKGDKLGRVHYQNERVFTVVIP